MLVCVCVYPNLGIGFSALPGLIRPRWYLFVCLSLRQSLAVQPTALAGLELFILLLYLSVMGAQTLAICNCVSDTLEPRSEF